jgi:hypothetical protein
VHLIIQFSNGLRAEAVVLALAPNTMRLAVVGADDAMDCRMSYGHWTLENGDVLEVEAMVADEAACRLAAELFQSETTTRQAGN